jgi:uncharacterized protein (TIGR00369 family)
MTSDADALDRVRASFARQRMMETLGAEMAQCAPGRIVLEMPFRETLSQQHGFVHAGAITALMDSAAGYAAMSLAPPAAEVLTVEFKTNLLSPARAARFRAEGTVLKPGRTLMVAEARCLGLAEGGEKLIATLTATIMVLSGRADLAGTAK